MSAANSYTTANLISDVLLIGHIPLSNATFRAPEILALANLELQTHVVSQIQAVREGYYLDYVDFDPNDDGEFAVPSQSIAGGLANVEIVVNTAIIPVSHIDESEQFCTDAPMATGYGFFIRNNTVRIIPKPTQGGVIRLWFLRRPNTLVQTSACARITAIVGNVITVASLPSTMTVGEQVNLCQDQPQFDVLSETEITGISLLDVTLDTVPTTLQVGDWLTLADQTCVPMIPVEFRVLLVQRVVVKIYELQGYLDKMKAAEAALEKLEVATFKLITPRTQSQTKVVNPQNGGFMGRGYNRYFYVGR